MKISWTTLRPRLLYGAFTLVAFVLALRWTFPDDAVRERLMLEAGTRGWQIDVQRVQPGPGLSPGVRLDGVSLTDGELTIPLERLDASIELFPLLIGRRVLDFRASVFGGTVGGSAALSGESRRVELAVADVDLARALSFRKATRLELGGILSGTVDLTVPGGALDKASGRIELAVAQAGIAGGQIPVPPMSGSLTLPPLSLGAVAAAARLGEGRATVEKLEAKGGDAELTTDAVSVVLQPRLEFAPVTGRAQLRLQPALWQKPAAAALRPVAEAALASSRGPDGAYQFQISGALGHPLLQPVAGRAGVPPPAPPPPPAAPGPGGPAAD
jgi:type II secretion system protein N